jgi:4-hydroxy-tetrahydrodipicolinate synthase
VRFAKLETGAEGISEWVAKAERAIAVFGGNAGLHLLDCLDAGAAGIAPGAEVTDLLVAIHGHWRDGRRGAAWSAMRELLPLLVYESSQGIDHFNACAKHVLVRRGVLTGSELRRPARGLDEPSRVLLDRYLADLGVLAAGALAPAT